MEWPWNDHMIKSPKKVIGCTPTVMETEIDIRDKKINKIDIGFDFVVINENAEINDIINMVRW